MIEALVFALSIIAVFALGCYLLWEAITDYCFGEGLFGVIVILLCIVMGVCFLHEGKENPAFFMRTIETSEIHQIDTLFMNGEPIKYTIHCK